jgi:hypothetical protein
MGLTYRIIREESTVVELRGDSITLGTPEAVDLLLELLDGVAVALREVVGVLEEVEHRLAKL